MKKTIFKTAVLVLTAIMTISCSKDGTTGATGPAGANGINGTNGTNGNANVFGTTDYTIVPGQWLSSGNSKYVNLGNNAITQNIINNGLVMVYQKVNSSAYIALPYTNSGFNTGFGIWLNNLQIAISASDNSSFSVTGDITIRAVIISASNKMANPNTDWKDYEQVKEALNLQD